MGVITGPGSVVERVKYDDCVKALYPAPVSVDWQKHVNSKGFMPLLSQLSESSMHIHVSLWLCYY